MKKILALASVALFLLTSSCKKDDGADTQVSASGSWTLNGVTHKAAYTTKSTTSDGNTLFMAFDKLPNDPAVNSFNLSFKTAPTAGGTYQLVAFGSATASNQVEVFAGSSAGVYAYRGAAINVTVTLSGGKYKVVIPEITVMGTAGTPDVKLSGTFQEM